MTIPTKVTDRLRQVFSAHAVSEHLEGTIAQIVDQLADGSLSIETVDLAVATARTESQFHIRRNLVGLLLYYLDQATRDGKLTSDELADIRFLKVSFRLRQGEVMQHGREKARELLDREMRRMLRDELVDQAELSYQTELQAAMGLGYDEFLELTREAFDDVVESWIRRLAADETVSDDERREFDRKIQRLSTVYPLTVVQKRGLRVPT
jgi:hypothetical protein